LRRVGGEPREHLAALRAVEEGRGERGQVSEDFPAQVRDDALAQRGDQVEARRAGQRQHRRHRDHHHEIGVDQLHPARGEAEIDHAADRDRHRQCRQCRHHQCRQRRPRPPAIAQDVRNEQLERLDFDLAAAHCGCIRERRELAAAPWVTRHVVHFRCLSQADAIAATGAHHAPQAKARQL
jgi:hypothetical protein